MPRLRLQRPKLIISIIAFQAIKVSNPTYMTRNHQSYRQTDGRTDGQPSAAIARYGRNVHAALKISTHEEHRAVSL